MKYKIIKTTEYNELKVQPILYNKLSLEFEAYKKAHEEAEEVKQEWRRVTKVQEEETLEKWRKEYEEYKKQADDELDRYRDECQLEKEKLAELFHAACKQLNAATVELDEARKENSDYIEGLKKERASYSRHMEEEYQRKSVELIEYYKLKNEVRQKEYDELFFKQHKLSYIQFENTQLKEENKLLKTSVKK